MAPKAKYRLSPPAIAADRSALLAVQDLAGYNPINPQYSLAALQALNARLAQAEQSEDRIQRTLDIARDEAVEAAWELHEAILGVKAQVLAQYGPDSRAIEAVGLKRRSERKRPVQRRSSIAP